LCLPVRITLKLGDRTETHLVVTLVALLDLPRHSCRKISPSEQGYTALFGCVLCIRARWPRAGEGCKFNSLGRFE
jgi:hypothetical protein